MKEFKFLFLLLLIPVLSFSQNSLKDTTWIQIDTMMIDTIVYYSMVSINYDTEGNKNEYKQKYRTKEEMLVFIKESIKKIDENYEKQEVIAKQAIANLNTLENEKNIFLHSWKYFQKDTL